MSWCRLIWTVCSIDLIRVIVYGLIICGLTSSHSNRIGKALARCGTTVFGPLESISGMLVSRFDIDFIPFHALLYYFTSHLTCFLLLYDWLTAFTKLVGRFLSAFVLLQFSLAFIFIFMYNCLGQPCYSQLLSGMTSCLLFIKPAIYLEFMPLACLLCTHSAFWSGAQVSSFKTRVWKSTYCW